MIKSEDNFLLSSEDYMRVQIQNYTGYSNDLEYRKIVGIFPDRGERYLDTIYDKEWCNKIDTGILNVVQPIKQS
jgi:hypothetical protein